MHLWLADTLTCSAAKLAAFLDPGIPWSAVAAQMNLAPWETPVQGTVPPLQAAATAPHVFGHPILMSSTQPQAPTNQLESAGQPGAIIEAGKERQHQLEGHAQMQNGQQSGGLLDGSVGVPKVFVAAGTAHGLVHVWQALGWGTSMWQRTAVKGQVRTCMSYVIRVDSIWSCG